MTEFLLLVAASLAGLTAAAAVVLLGAGLAQWGRTRDAGLVPYIVYPIMLTIGFGVLLSGRNLNLPVEIYGWSAAKPWPVVWAGRLTAAFIVLSAGERIARYALTFLPRPRVPTILILAFGIYFLTNVVTSAILGKDSSLSHGYLYPALVCLAATLSTRGEGETAVRALRSALLIFLFAGLATLPWQPDLVAIRGYHGFIPGLDFRLAGLSNHPNAQGMLAALFLICLRSQPYGKPWLTTFGWLIGLGCLLLAQSKTSWIAFVVCLLCMTLYRHGSPRLAFYAKILPAAMVGAIAIALTVMFKIDEIMAFMTTPTGADLLSLTGRDRIWAVAVEEWRSNPLFGYGLNIWGDSHRQSIGLPYAFNAHNQFYQSLASSGSVGAIGLAVYALALLTYSLKTSRSSQGMTLALFILLLLLSISEVPLSMNGYAPDLLLHSLLLILIASHLSGHRRDSGKAKDVNALAISGKGM